MGSVVWGLWGLAGSLASTLMEMETYQNALSTRVAGSASGGGYF